MSFIHLLALVSLTPFLSAHAAESVFGAAGTIQMTVVENPQTHFKHYVATYIPKSVNVSADTPVVIFLHGGSGVRWNADMKVENGEIVNCTGQIHCSKEYGKNQIQMYLNTSEGVKGLTTLAEEGKFIAILPGSNIGWTGESIPLFKSLKESAMNQFHTRPELFVLAGHSMGAMGIVRTAGNMKGEFKAFLAFSGTLNAREMSYEYVRKLVTVPLYLINEEQVMYQSFLTQSAILKEYSDNIAEAYGVQNQFKFVVAHGNHNNVMDSFPDSLNMALAAPTLNQPELTEKSPKPVYTVAKSKWAGNVACGTLSGVEKYHFDAFHPTKQMFVYLDTQEEGLFDSATGEIEKTYLPRKARVEFMTYSEGRNKDFVKSLPKALPRMAREQGPILCSMYVFDTEQLKDNVLDQFFVAGKTLAEARQNLLQELKSRTK